MMVLSVCTRSKLRCERILLCTGEHSLCQSPHISQNSDCNSAAGQRIRSHLMFWISMASVSCTVYQHCPWFRLKYSTSVGAVTCHSSSRFEACRCAHSHPT